MKQRNTVRLTICGLAVLGGLFAYSESGTRVVAHADGTSAPQVTTITVTGTNIQSLAPDTVVVNAGATETATTAQAAQTKMNTVIHSVMNTLGGLSIPANDVQTSNYNLQPNYSQQSKDGQQVLTGFTTNENLSIQLQNVAQAGALIDTLVKVGVNQINGVNYEISNPNQAEAQAYGAAMKDARNQANTIAQALGSVITGVQSVTTANNGVGPIYPMASFATKSSSDSTSLAPGAQQISTSVTVVFTISNTTN
jgi:uncharacterized protein